MIGPVLLAVALALGFGAAAFVILWLDRYGAEPVIRLGLVALWGLACPLLFRLADPRLGLAGNPEASSGPGLLSAGFAVLQQLALAAALAVVATSSFLEGPLDGAVYGLVAGLGLAISGGLMAMAAPWPAGWIGVPTFFTLVGATAAAVVGAGIGFAKLALRPVLRVPCVLVAVLAAALLRWLLFLAARWGWEIAGRDSIALNLALIVVSAALLVGVFAAALAFERRVLAAQLGEEVRLGVLPEWVAEVLPSYRRRVRSAWWPKRDERREIVRLLTSLAYRKHRLRGLPDESARLYGLEVGRMRQRARTLMAFAPSGAARDGGGGADGPPGGEGAQTPRG